MKSSPIIIQKDTEKTAMVSPRIKTFPLFMEMIEKNNTFCNHIKRHTVKSFLPEIKKEILELEQEISSPNYNHDNIKEEIADILYNVFVLVKLSKNEVGASFDELFQLAIDKIKRRKPHIFENRSVSIEEASKYWKEAKIREMENKNVKKN